MKVLEIKAGNVEEAITKGLNELGKKREEVQIEIVDAGGFLKKARVVLRYDDSDGEKALKFVRELTEKMKFSVVTELKEDGEKLELCISGEDSGNVIGYRGEVLDSIQYVTSIVANKGRDDYKKVIVDCADYRKKRTETLVALAARLAEKAVATGRKVALEPMNPFERRVIHASLQENADVKTTSEGIEPGRFVVIIPNNLKDSGYIRDDRSRAAGQGGYANRQGGYNNNRGGGQGGGRDGRRDNRQGGYNANRGVGRDGQRDNRQGGYNANRQGGYNNNRDGQRDSRPGGYNANRSGQGVGRDEQRDNRQSGYTANREGGDNREAYQSQPRTPAPASFSGFGTYLGNSKSGFSENDITPKENGFDNLKD
jgi:spoIIIJ-associated protein